MRLSGSDFYFLKAVLFIPLIYIGILFGQTHTPVLRLKSGTFSPPVLESPIKENPDWVQDHSFNGKTYLILQFQSLPDPVSKQKIQNLGIQLLTYLPENAWVASIPAQFDWHQLAPFSLRSILPLAPQHKIHSSLQGAPFPDWTVPHPDSIDLRLTWHPGITDGEVLAALASLNVKILPNPWKYGPSTHIRIPQDQIIPLAAESFVHYLEPVAPPSYPENGTARTLHRTNLIDGAYPGSRKYNGEGVVVAMGDDGIIGPHIDYRGRTNQSQVSGDGGDHGDHIAGTIMGAGNLNPRHRGMAPAAIMHPYNVWDAVFDSPTSHINDGVVITSTSYSNGCNAGYTNWAASADQMMRSNPSLIHVFSAGNSGIEDCGYGAGAGWGNVTGGIKIGKNVLCVGNLTFSDQLAGSSSRGPAEDGRIKPDLCAKGTNVNSTIAGNSYASFTGTSMSCPGVSGTLAQLYHAYRLLNSGNNPDAALLKGTLMNTCEDLGTPGPDFRHGYGRINAFRAVQTIENGNWFTDSIDQNGTRTHTLTVPPGIAELRVMLYWTDWEGSPAASAPLVNDLDLTVTDPSNNDWLPWVLDPRASRPALEAPATRLADHLNNAEQVTLEAPVPGTYTFTITESGVPMGPQAYYLVYEIQDSSLMLTWPVGGEHFVPGETESIRWDCWGDYGSFDLEYSMDNGSSWSYIAQNVDSSRRYYDWSVPNVVTGEALVRVSRNGQMDTSHTTFSILRVPANLREKESCPDFVVLEWDSVPGALTYEVFQLGNMYMDSIGTTSATQFTILGTDLSQSYWFAVRALGPNGAVGQRTIAIQRQPGVRSCSVPNDIAVDSVAFPDNATYLNCSDLSQAQVRIRLTNFSPNAISQVPVFASITGFPLLTDTFPGPLAGYEDTVFTFSTPVDLSNPGVYSIEAWASFLPDAHNLNDSARADFRVLDGSPLQIPITEDFEAYNACNRFSPCAAGCVLTGDWQNVTNGAQDDIDWRVNRGTTPGGGTGPFEDHNPGDPLGKYLYLESSNCFEQEARLLSPCIDLGTVPDPEVAFWFHHYGSESGNLFLDLYVDGEWLLNITAPILAEWGNKWWERRVDLTPWAGKIVALRWRATTGPGALSDMALDDITIRSAITSRDPNRDQHIQIYPNPNHGQFRLESSAITIGQVNIQVWDLNGKAIFKETLFSNGSLSHDLDLGDLDAGMYFLGVQTTEGSFQKKLVIW